MRSIPMESDSFPIWNIYTFVCIFTPLNAVTTQHSANPLRLFGGGRTQIPIVLRQKVTFVKIIWRRVDVCVGAIGISCGTTLFGALCGFFVYTQCIPTIRPHPPQLHL